MRRTLLELMLVLMRAPGQAGKPRTPLRHLREGVERRFGGGE